MTPYEIFEHTADIGVRISGETLEEFFAEAARGMFAVILEGGVEGWPTKHRVELKSPDIECLLVDWLSELLYLFDVKKFVFEEADFEVVDEAKICATVRGTQYRGSIGGTEVKAVTHHLLEVSRTLAGFEASVIFDL